MTRAVYKYSIEAIRGDQVVHMPMGSTVVKIAPQNGQICIWAIVNTDVDVEKVPTSYRIVGTGQTIPDEAVCVETVFMEEFVWHVFRTGGYHV